MLFYKKILIVIIIILFSYLVFRLINKRKQIINYNYSNPNILLESFLSGIQLSNTYPQTLTLNQYCIKASLNSAYNITSRNIDCDPNNGGGILKIVLQRGVRFLDFEIYSVADKPIVGYSSSYDSTNTINEASNNPKTDTFIQLNNIFKFILSNKPTNITDPLFIQLRIKTQKTELYSTIAEYIHHYFDGALYLKGKITENTILSDINNKIIIVVDAINSNSSYSNLDKDHPFKELVNLETGTSLTTIPTNTLIQSSQKRININTDGVTITANEKPPLWTLTYPDLIATSNPDIKSLMNKQCPNIIQCRFDYDDTNLSLYEQIFRNQSFVPIGNAYTIASKL
jgi:hypothetical protein